ncbi:hypothetical protein BGX28_002006, partial [Mortierella sp. GBA30]
VVAAQNKIPFFKSAASNPVDSAKEQQVLDLKALSSSFSISSTSSSSDSSGLKEIQDDGIKKQKRLSKGKGLLGAVFAERSSSAKKGTENPKKKQSKKEKKKNTGHEDDIIHEYDHANNDAYDDIVWYEGPHRDDEDEHGYEDDHYHDHDDDHDDEHDEDDHEDVDENDGHEHDDEHHVFVNRVPKRAQHPVETKPEVLANLKLMGGVRPRTSAEKGSESQSEAEDRRTGSGSLSSATVLQSVPYAQYEHQHSSDGGASGVFHHSGADILEGTVSATEFCLRLKHECESTCREFQSQIKYLTKTCETGSVAELLLWGMCCQIGYEHRMRKWSTTRHAELAEHVREDANIHRSILELDALRVCLDRQES